MDALTARLPVLRKTLDTQQKALRAHEKMEKREQELAYVVDGRQGRSTEVYLRDKEEYRGIGDKVETALCAYQDADAALTRLVDDLAEPLEVFCQGEANRMIGEIETFLDSYRVKGDTRGNFAIYPGKVRLWQSKAAMIYQPGAASQVTAGKLIAFLEEQSKAQA